MPYSDAVAVNKILLIKSFCVSAESCEKAATYFKGHDPNNYIILAGNQEACERLVDNTKIDENIFYGLGGSISGRMDLLKLLFKLRKKKVDDAVILIEDYFPGGYRKAKLLAVFSGAKRAKIYFLRTQITQSLGSFTLRRISLNAISSALLLAIVVTVFSISIVFPMELKKFLKK